MLKSSNDKLQRNSWANNYNRGAIENHLEAEQDDSGDCDDSEPNQRENHNSKNFTKEVKEYKGYRCATEPFKETLRLLDKLFPASFQI